MESVSLLRSLCFQEGEVGQRERERETHTDLRICSCIHSVHHPFIHSFIHPFIHSFTGDSTLIRLQVPRSKSVRVPVGVNTVCPPNRN